MNCPRCGTAHPNPAKKCRRCASPLPQPRCKQCKASIDWGRQYCDRHLPEEPQSEESCPACGVLNDPEADYCAQCGSPMAVITRVIAIADGDEHPDPWRVYGVETALIGRDDELQSLESILDEAAESSSSRLAVITARHGLGKSRLVAEFQRRLEASFSTTAVLRGVCREEVGGAFSVITRMLRSRFYIPEGDTTEMARRRLHEAVEALVGERAEHISRLVGELIGLPFPTTAEETTGEVSPPNLETPSFRAVEQLLRADAARNPLLIILDDIHLASGATHRLLRHLIDELNDVPVLFVLSQTDSTDRGIDPDEADLLLELAPLSDDEVRQQVTNTLRLADDVPTSMIEDIVDAALGNPLAVEEILRIFLSEGIIDTRQEPWQIDVERIDDIELPRTVEESVEARLKGLTDDERRILEMAACVGTIFWRELIHCLDRLRRNAEERPENPLLPADDIGGGGERVDELLESLERKDMIRRQSEQRLRDQEEIYFKHRLERETIHQGLPARIRQRYHRLIGQWMDRQSTESTDGASEFIARHYAKARCLRRAATHFLDAGDEARRQHANQKAIDLYLEALGCLSDADMDLKMRAFHDLGSVCELLGEHRQSLTYYHDMARYAWLLNDRSKGGAALNKIGRAHRGLGNYDASLRHFERALDLFRAAEDERGVASTLDDIGMIYWVRGEQSGAFEYYTAALEMRRALDDPRSIALSLSHIGSLKLSLGDLPEAMVYYREALELRKQVDDPRGLAASYNQLGGLCIERGRNKKALPLFEKALSIAREIGYRGLESAILNNTGEALTALKRRDEAREHLTQAKEIATAIGQQRVLFDVLRNLAELAIGDADRALAIERIEGALKIAHDLDSRSYIAIGELTRAQIHSEYIFDSSLRDESIKKATEAYEQAIELLDETGVDVQLANALSSFGNFFIELGSPEKARPHLDRAASIFDELKMNTQKVDTQSVLESL